VQRIVRVAQHGGCDPVVAVTGAFHESVAASLTELNPRLVANHLWSRGIGSSIRTGLRHLMDENIGAVILLTCDQPAVDATVIRGLIETHEKTGRPVVASHYAGTLGVPALFHRSLFDELMRLPDENGAKILIEKDASRVAAQSFPNGIIDLDKPEDLLTCAAFVSKLSPSSFDFTRADSCG
jgi:molybdenum cofactor cytidylyltransferase